MADDSINIDVNIRSTGGDAAAADVSNLGAATKAAAGEAGRTAGTMAGELAPAMEKAGKSAEHAAGGAEHATIRHRELHRAASMLGPVIGELAVALSDLAHNPTMAVILLVSAFGEAMSKIREVNEEMTKLEEEAAKPLSKTLETQRDGVVSLAASLADLGAELHEAGKGEITLKESMEAAIARSKQQSQAANELGEAAKANDLARLSVWHQQGVVSEEEYSRKRLEIEQAYRERKRQIDEQAEATEYMLRRRAQGVREGNQADLTKAAEDAARTAAEKSGALANIEADKPGVAKRREDAAKKMSDWENESGWQDVGTGTSQKALAEIFHRFIDPKTGQITGSPESAKQAVWATQGVNRTSGELIEKKFEEWSKLQASKSTTETAYRALPAQETRVRLEADAARRAAEIAAKKAEDNARLAADEKKDLDNRRVLMDDRAKANRDLAAQERATMAMATPEGQHIQWAMRSADQWMGAGGRSNQIDAASRSELEGLYREMFGIKGNRKIDDRTLQGTFGGASDAGKFTGLYGRERASEDIGTAEAAAQTQRAHRKLGDSSQKVLLHIGELAAGHQVTLDQAAAAVQAVTRNQQQLIALLGKLRAEMDNAHNY